MNKRLMFNHPFASLLTTFLFSFILFFFVAVCQGDDYKINAHLWGNNSACVAPQLPELGPFNILEGERLTFSFHAKDSDPNAKLVYRVLKKPRGARIKETRFSWVPEFGDQGTYTPSIRVCDMGCFPRQCDTKWFEINVGRNECRPPVLDPIGNFVSVIGNTVEFQVSATDPDTPTDSLTYTYWPIGTGWINLSHFDPETNYFSWTPTLIEDEGGIQTPHFIVCDDCPSGPLCDEEVVTINIVTTPKHFFGNWMDNYTANDDITHGLTISPVRASKKWMYIRLYGACLAPQCEIAKGYIRFDGRSYFRTTLYTHWGKVKVHLSLDNEGTYLRGGFEIDYKDRRKEDRTEDFYGFKVEAFDRP